MKGQRASGEEREEEQEEAEQEQEPRAILILNPTRRKDKTETEEEEEKKEQTLDPFFFLSFFSSFSNSLLLFSGPDSLALSDWRCFRFIPVFILFFFFFFVDDLFDFVDVPEQG